MWGCHDGGWWVLMMLWMLLFWGAIVAGAVWLVASIARRSNDQSRVESAKEILDRRLAAGEIDADEYRKIRDELSG